MWWVYRKSVAEQISCIITIQKHQSLATQRQCGILHSYCKTCCQEDTTHSKFFLVTSWLIPFRILKQHVRGDLVNCQPWTETLYIIALGVLSVEPWNCTGDAVGNPHVSLRPKVTEVVLMVCNSFSCFFISKKCGSQGTVSHSRCLNNTINVCKSKRGASCKLTQRY